jgi:hypothetical protein
MRIFIIISKTAEYLIEQHVVSGFFRVRSFFHVAQCLPPSLRLPTMKLNAPQLFGHALSNYLPDVSRPRSL